MEVLVEGDQVHINIQWLGQLGNTQGLGQLGNTGKGDREGKSMRKKKNQKRVMFKEPRMCLKDK